MNDIKVSEKYLLTIREAAVYFQIGEKKLRRMIQEDPYADYLLAHGNRILIKRKMFEKFIDSTSSI